MASSTQPRSSNSSGRSPKRTPIPQGPKFNCAFGYILYADTLSLWAEHYYEQAHGTTIRSLPKEEQTDAVFMMFVATLELLALEVYEQIPTLPRLRRRVIPLDPSTLTYLFVLQDNSSPEALNSHINEEDLVKMAEVLKITDQKPNWYRIKRQI